MRYTPLATDALCPMPYALCPMPYALCPQQYLMLLRKAIVAFYSAYLLKIEFVVGLSAVEHNNKLCLTKP
jgi:hypothetical protein